MTIELMVWNRNTGAYEPKQVIEDKFARLQDIGREYDVRSIYTHPFSPEVRIFADPKENENA